MSRPLNPRAPGAPFGVVDQNGHGSIMKPDGTPAAQSDIDAWAAAALAEKTAWNKMSPAEKRAHLDGLKK